MQELLTSTKLLFFSYYLAFGAYSPYIVRYMSKIGLSGKQIGFLQGFTSLLGFVLPPLWGLFIDVKQNKRQSLVLALSGMAIGLMCYFFSSSFWPLLLATLVYAAFNAPVIPLLDSIALEAADKTNSYYGNMRMFGSLGYAVSASFMPYIYNHFDNPGSIFPVSLIFTILTMFLICRLSPNSFSSVTSNRSKAFKNLSGDFVKLIKNPAFLGLMLVAFINRLALVPYYSFISLYLEGLNATSFIVGYAWAVAILGEMVVLFNSEKMLKRLGEKRLLVIALFLSSIRWIIYAKVQLPWVIFSLQWLHGFSFAAIHTVTVKLILKIAPQTMQVSAQSLYSAFNFGLGGFFGSLIMGFLFDYFGGAKTITTTMGSLLLVCASASFLALTVCMIFVQVKAPKKQSLS